MVVAAPPIMGDADSVVASAKTSHHYISDSEVINARVLAKKGEQRLRKIVEGETNFFYFSVPCDGGHRASVEVVVSPITSEDSPHPLYVVRVVYIACHDAVQLDEVLETAQLVYSTYIRVTWLTLDADWYGAIFLS